MKRTSVFILALIMAVSAHGQGTSLLPGITQPHGNAVGELPFVELNPTQDGKVKAPASGTVNKNGERYSIPDLNDSIILHIPKTYTLFGKESTIVLNLMIFNLESAVDDNQAIVKDEQVGMQKSAGPRFIIFSEELEDYLVLMSGARPAYYANKYWFNPAFLFRGGHFPYLDYKEVDVAKALKEVADDATSEGPGFVLYPDYKVRFLTQLQSYPKLLDTKQLEAIQVYENELYGRAGINESYSEIIVGDYKYLIIWQKGFAKYLSDEYEIGKDLWLYGAIATFDVWQNEGYVFIRDFFQEPPESLVRKHYAFLEKSVNQ